MSVPGSRGTVQPAAGSAVQGFSCWQDRAEVGSSAGKALNASALIAYHSLPVV